MHIDRVSGTRALLFALFERSSGISYHTYQSFRMTQSLIFYCVSPTILVAIKYGINLSIGAAMVGHLVLKPVHLAMRK